MPKESNGCDESIGDAKVDAEVVTTANCGLVLADLGHPERTEVADHRAQANGLGIMEVPASYFHGDALQVEAWRSTVLMSPLVQDLRGDYIEMKFFGDERDILPPQIAASNALATRSTASWRYAPRSPYPGH